jgi:membrane-associated phospholipid phosphatase
MAKTLFSRLLLIRLRFAEKTILAFFAALLIASLTLSLPGTTVGVLAVLNVMIGGLIVALSKDDPVEANRMASPLRDWLPALLMLLAYRESGLFIKADPAHRLDHLFILWDQAMLHSRWVQGLLYSCAPWLQYYLEICYLLCYPLVPLGFAALYLTRPSIASPRQPSRMLKDLSFRGVPRPRDDEESRGSLVSRARFLPFALLRVGMARLTDVFRHPARSSGLGVNLHHQPLHPAAMFDKFWTAVLLATLFCYAIYPVFPLTPPRVLFNDVPGPPVSPLLRHMNLWVLNRLSVHACVFPSAHTAAVTATALAVRAYRPRLGILFCIVALSVAVATVYGRYHYAADAVAGALAGVVGFVVSSRIHRA